MRLLLPATAIVLTACATAPERPPDRLHHMVDDRDPKQSALCMAPSGEGLPWVENPRVRHPDTGEATFTCPAPAYFVLMPRCVGGEETFMDESPEHRALRVRFGSDGSFHGDSYGGRRFCMPASPH